MLSVKIIIIHFIFMARNTLNLRSGSSKFREEYRPCLQVVKIINKNYNLGISLVNLLSSVT